LGNPPGGTTGWIMTRIGMAYHAPPADDAKARILGFFVRHLR
jgi:hypothetical protein